ncbi:hypothetical protein [Acidovorax sp. LjRoot117]|uniref:hypothetical protein n=1 Tax=Acidovorax sp. LjRoot117 TaxID=3342255 RepID=UPI003ED0A4EC
MPDITAVAPTRANKAPPKAKATATDTSVQTKSNEADLLLQEALLTLNFVLTDLCESSIPAGAAPAATEAQNISYGMCHDKDEEANADAPGFTPSIEFWTGVDLLERQLNAVMLLLGKANGLELRGAIAAVPLVEFARSYLESLTDAVAAGSNTALRALTTFAGARQFRDRPSPPIRRVGDSAEGPYSLQQLRSVLTAVAGVAVTLDQVLMNAQASDSEWNTGVLIDSAQILARHLGGMADCAVGGTVQGDHDRWNYGPNFAQEGKAGAA